MQKKLRIQVRLVDSLVIDFVFAASCFPFKIMVVDCIAVFFFFEAVLLCRGIA